MIYYVEDDDNIRELVVYTLTQMSLPCRGFADGIFQSLPLLGCQLLLQACSSLPIRSQNSGAVMAL